MRQGWEIKRLGEIGTFQRGGGFLKSDYVEDGFPCIHYGQIHTRFGVKTLSHLTCIPKQLALSKSKIAHKGDIVIAITSEDVEGSCKCTAWMGDYDVAVGGHAAIFRHNLNPAFVAYYFRGAYFQTAKTVFAHGSKVVEIKPNDIATIKIAYPSLPEQEKIVAELDCLSGIIEKKKQQLKEYDALAQSIFYEMFGNPIDNEKGWEVKKWEEVFDTRTGKLNANVMNENGKYPFFTCSKDIFYIDTYAFDCEALLLAGNNATANYDVKYYKGKFNAYQRTYVLTLKDNSLYKFFKFALENKLSLLQEQSIGGMTKYLTLGILHKIEFIVPPLALQQEFADKIEAIEKQKALIKHSITQTEELFNARMAYYFN